MLDSKQVRQNPEALRDMLARRHKNVDIAPFLENDEKRRAMLPEIEALRAKRTEMSARLAAVKRQGGDDPELVSQVRALGDEMTALENDMRALEQAGNAFLMTVPNFLDESVPDGADDQDNQEVRRWGEPRTFDFPLKPHWDLGTDLHILDFETGAKVSGTRFTFLRGLGAKLERSLISFYLNTHTADGFDEVYPPYIVSRATMTGTGQLPKFEEDAYRLSDGESFLIPTAEVPVTNMYRDTILEGSQLPIRHVAYSVCFRSEAGSAGRDTRGYIRQHQFNKVEMVKVCKPEQSADELESMTRQAEKVLKLLGLPYRVVCLCAGDTGFSAAKTYDIEVWMPSYNRYVEISSCSNCKDFQARRAQIRYRDGAKGKPQLAHTLNGSGVAVGRTVAAILENYQNADGTITVPEALRPYMGCDVIG